MDFERSQFIEAETPPVVPRSLGVATPATYQSTLSSAQSQWMVQSLSASASSEMHLTAVKRLIPNHTSSPILSGPRPLRRAILGGVPVSFHHLAITRAYLMAFSLS